MVTLSAGVPRALPTHYRLAGLGLAAFLFACSEQSTAPEPADLAVSVTARYTVRTINHHSLPVTICSGKVKVRSGVLRLRSDKTFLATARISSPPTTAAETYQESGTYARRPGTNRLVFTSQSRPGVVWEGVRLADGSLRISYPICGGVLIVRVAPA